MNGPRGDRLRDDARRILGLAWPLFAGQVAVLGFSTVDTVLLGRRSTLDLAALAIGSASYVSVFIGLMGVVMAVGPIAARHFGAQRLDACGRQLIQALWLAIGLSLVGGVVLLNPAPILALSRATPEVAAKVRSYLGALAIALPAALMFAALRGFHSAVSRPKVVMGLQLAALAVKVPLTMLLALGATLPAALGGVAVPALGVAGCGIATAVVMWLQCLAGAWWVRHDPFYAPFGLQRRGWPRLDIAALLDQLRLGIPMGLSILVEVTGFTFMAFFISRLGAIPVAGHAIAVNLAGLLFMLPLALSTAASALVGQRLGADDPQGARRVGWHAVQLAGAIAAIAGLVLLLLRDAIVRRYTPDIAVGIAASQLLAIVVVFHLVDALQAVSAGVLRAHRVVKRPLAVYALSVWGLGLAGGCLVGLDPFGLSPAWLQGPRGFWVAQTAGLMLAAVGLLAMLRSVSRERAGSR